MADSLCTYLAHRPCRVTGANEDKGASAYPTRLIGIILNPTKIVNNSLIDEKSHLLLAGDSRKP